MVFCCRFDQLKLTQAFLFESLDKICFDMLYFDSLFDVTQKQNLRQDTHLHSTDRKCPHPLPPEGKDRARQSLVVIERPTKIHYMALCLYRLKEAVVC
jgi:hypothetical protein